LEVELDEPHELVRVFIDRDGGIGLEHCEAVTLAIRDTCPEYALEVSSPGLERPMRRPSHFRDAVGKQVRLRRAGAHRATHVAVVDVDDVQGVTFRPDDGEDIVVPFDQIVRCKLVAEDPFAANGKPSRKARRKGRAS
jgi:ribosome maturation factor RimP